MNFGQRFFFFWLVICWAKLDLALICHLAFFFFFFGYWVLVNLEFRNWVDMDVGCAKEQGVCAKCRCRVGRIVGRFCLKNLLLWYIYIHYLFCGCMKFCSFGVCSCRDSSEVEAEQKLLDEVVILFYFLPTVKWFVWIVQLRLGFVC